MTSLKAALFDISGHNFAFRASFNRRKKLLTMKTARKTGYLSFFPWLTTWLCFFFSILFHKKIHL